MTGSEDPDRPVRVELRPSLIRLLAARSGQSPLSEAQLRLSQPLIRDRGAKYYGTAIGSLGLESTYYASYPSCVWRDATGSTVNASDFYGVAYCCRESNLLRSQIGSSFIERSQAGRHRALRYRSRHVATGRWFCRRQSNRRVHPRRESARATLIPLDGKTERFELT